MLTKTTPLEKAARIGKKYYQSLLKLTTDSSWVQIIKMKSIIGPTIPRRSSDKELMIEI